MTFSISVKYQFIENHHVFTSKDVPGLLVVSKDAETAYNDVPQSIQALLKLSKDKVFTVEPLMPFDDFLPNCSESFTEASKAVPSRLLSQDYAISAQA